MNFKFYLFILLSILFGNNIYAALPPYVAAERKIELMESVKELRQNTQNIVTMKVIKVELEKLVLDECPSIESLSIQAIVEDVQKGNLQKDDLINITYSQKVYRCPGPQNYYPKNLKQETVTSAYLQCIKKECTISAGAWSFHTEAEFLNEFIETSAENEYWKLHR